MAKIKVRRTVDPKSWNRGRRTYDRGKIHLGRVTYIEYWRFSDISCDLAEEWAEQWAERHGHTLVWPGEDL